MLLTATLVAISRSGTIIPAHPQDATHIYPVASSTPPTTCQVAIAWTGQDGLQADQEVEIEYRLIRGGQEHGQPCLGTIRQFPPFGEDFHLAEVGFVNAQGNPIRLQGGDKIKVTFKFKDHQGSYQTIDKISNTVRF